MLDPFRKDFLVVVNAHSKWMEIEVANTATTQVTLEHLRAINVCQI